MFGFPVFRSFVSKSGTLGPSGEGQNGGESEKSMLLSCNESSKITPPFNSVLRDHTTTSGLLLIQAIKKPGTGKTSSLKSLQHGTLKFLATVHTRASKYCL